MAFSTLSNENPDKLAKASDWLDAQRAKHRTRPVAYRRGNHTIQVPATIGRTNFDVTDEHNNLTRVEATDFLISAADLKWPVGGRPCDGDKILMATDESPDEPGSYLIRVYELLSLPGVPPWKFSDPNNRTFRIHTKLVKEYTGTVTVEETIP